MEVFYSGTWGTICGEYWDILDAIVVCRQLGYFSALTAEGKGSSGKARLWLHNVQCQGSESSIDKCFNNGWDITDRCRSNQYASVVCTGWTIL